MPTEADKEKLQKKDLLWWVESLIVLWPRYLLIMMYACMVMEMVKIICYHMGAFVGLVTATDEKELELTMQALGLLDGTMLVNLIWLIVAGSFYVFVALSDDTERLPRRKPQCLQDLTPAALKEIMAASIVGVSAIYLLRCMMHIVPNTWVGIAEIVGLHITFIAAFMVFFKAASHIRIHLPKGEEEKNIEGSH